MIAIVDYGMGNIHSVQKALESLGADTLVTSRPGDIAACDKILLPGVGAFDDAIAELKRYGLTEALRQGAAKKKPLLGICLGMQLLFEKSEEAKKSSGLGLLKGRVVRFKPLPGIKVPHMGWNELKAASSCPLLKDIPEAAYVYFCHSYYPEPADKKVIAATTEYAGVFASMVWKGNLYGTQFHPEKSQRLGLKILENFVNLC